MKTAAIDIMRHLTTLRSFADRGEYKEMKQYGENRAIVLCSSLIALDMELTGKCDGRNSERDLKQAKKLAEGEDWLVYLSDGGYSRIMLQFTDPNFALMYVDSVSLERVKHKWKEMEFVGESVIDEDERLMASMMD
jgi:hypothetical protein